jgi:hypothetical protein
MSSARDKFFDAEKDVSGAKKFMDMMMIAMDTALDSGSPETIQQRRLAVEAAFERYLDAVETKSRRWFEVHGVDPDKRHLWKRPNPGLESR